MDFLIQICDFHFGAGAVGMEGVGGGGVGGKHK